MGHRTSSSIALPSLPVFSRSGVERTSLEAIRRNHENRSGRAEGSGEASARNE